MATEDFDFYSKEVQEILYILHRKMVSDILKDFPGENRLEEGKTRRRATI